MRQTQIISGFVHSQAYVKAIACLVLACGSTLPTLAASVTSSTPKVEEAQQSEVTVKGEGATVFQFSVEDLEGNVTKFEIHTDETTVGAALMSLGLIEGEDGPHGLYVMKVNGITAIYEEDGSYWAFYENGEYGMTGVDMTDIDPDVAYSFVQTKD